MKNRHTVFFAALAFCAACTVIKKPEENANADKEIHDRQIETLKNITRIETDLKKHIEAYESVARAEVKVRSNAAVIILTLEPEGKLNPADLEEIKSEVTADTGLRRDRIMIMKKR